MMKRGAMMIRWASVLVSLAVSCCAGVARAQDFPNSWTPQIAPHASSWAFKTVGSGGVRAELRDGDCSEDRRTPECTTGRERAELVDRFEPTPGETLWYGYSLFIAGDNPVLPVHTTIGQWWSPSFVFAVRETKGALEFAVYTAGNSPPVKLCRVSQQQAPRDRWHRVVVQAQYGPALQRTVRAMLNGATICEWTGAVAPGDSRMPVWKIGIYRPNIGQVPSPHPTQVIQFRDVKRGYGPGDIE